MASQRDSDFLRLWREHGDKLTREEYARRLSVIEGKRVSGDTLKWWVSYHRARLFEEYGVEIGPRLVRADIEFEGWPQLPPELRRKSLYRLLEYHARVRVLGIDSLSESIRGRYLSRVHGIRQRNEIIRYAPGTGLYVDQRTPEEVEEDPKHERISETKAAYDRRQRRAGRGGG